jgi:hypothetical protein
VEYDEVFLFTFSRSCLRCYEYDDDDEEDDDEDDEDEDDE